MKSYRTKIIIIHLKCVVTKPPRTLTIYYFLSRNIL